ncbi:unnamed protein product [Phytophthora fragariaefolia]|uniref:Unnamed protein product n=1 Tax=Phytophthora fragariaefolia TaxID=1490495 RepID=A0A9W6U8J1_9STRA|nr:unnamed protein product [Phytophthora fragariaefolia]
MQQANEMFRTWLIHLHGLLPPAPDGDWLEFRAAVVHLLPEFRDVFMQPVQGAQASRMKMKIERDTKTLVHAFLQTRRRHLFGYHKLGSSVGDPSELISCTNLSRNCLLLVLAGYLASFNPQETDVRFLSSSGGQRRRKRVKKDTAEESSTPASTTTSGSKKQQISQLLIGPRIFTLQRLLAIYLNLRVEAEADDDSSSSETREDVFAHVSLVQSTHMPILLAVRLTRGILFTDRDTRANAVIPAYYSAARAGQHQVPLPRRRAFRPGNCTLPVVPFGRISQQIHIMLVIFKVYYT